MFKHAGIKSSLSAVSLQSQQSQQTGAVSGEIAAAFLVIMFMVYTAIEPFYFGNSTPCGLVTKSHTSPFYRSGRIKQIARKYVG